MRWYFDYISPYAYLQSIRLDEFAACDKLECTPVLFAGLLKHWETKGPAELESKRRWTFRDVAWLADKHNIELNLPPAHPFNPLPLLRLGIVHNNTIAVVQRLFRYVWAEGNSPQDSTAFKALLAELDTSEQALNTDEVKQTLRSNTDAAIDSGVFGVPTIEHNSELYWGNSATDMVLQLLKEPDSFPQRAIENADSLPQGPARSNTPTTSKNRTQKKDETRIPLKPLDLKEPADLVAAIRKRRGGELIELDRLLLYSTPLAEGWNHYVGNIRDHFSVEQKLRELAMCTVAILNKAEYEFSQHAPLYIKAGGSESGAQLLRKIENLPGQSLFNPAQPKDPVFTEEELLTINLTIQLTRDVCIDDAVFEHARQFFNDEHLVELIATIAAYNMVSRFLVAFELHPG